jgi:hypothetical protein
MIKTFIRMVERSYPSGLGIMDEVTDRLVKMAKVATGRRNMSVCGALEQ